MLLGFRRLLFFWGYAWIALGYVIVALTFDWILPLKGRLRITVFFTDVLMFWVRWILSIRIQVSGYENTRNIACCVIAANHQSAWETLYLQKLFVPVCTVMKKELLYIPLFGWVLFLIRPITLDRSQRIRALKHILRAGGKKLQHGVSVLIFPQGTRVLPPQIGKFNITAAKLATDAQVPLLPIAHNAGQCWKPGWSKTPGTIQLMIGKPISTQGKKTAQVQRELETWMQQNLLHVAFDVR